MKKGWELKSLGDVLVRTETTDPTRSPQVEFDYIDVSSVSNETLSIRETQRLKGRDAPSRARRLVAANDVLFATIRPTLRRIAIVPDELDKQVCSTGYFVLRPQSRVDFRFIFYYLQTEDFMREMEKLQKGASYPAVTDGDVRSQKIPVPPLPEQQRIVGVLDEAFAGLANAQAHAEKNVQNARALFESHLQSVFAQRGGTWEKKKLEDVCMEIFAGGDVPKDSHSKTPTEQYRIPIYTNGEKNNGLYGYVEAARVISPSITISARGTIGYTAIRSESYFPAVRLIVVIPHAAIVDLEFLYYAIKTMVIGHSGTSIPQLTVPMVREFSILMPALAEQRKIADQLDALAAETQRLESLYQQKLTALAALKKSLLHQAFSGQL